MKPRLLLGKLVTQLLPSARRPCCRSAAGLTPARQAAPWQSLFLMLFVTFCESSWSVVPMAAKIRGGLCRSSSRFHLKSRFAKLHRYPGLYPQNLLAEHGLPGSSVGKQGGAWACDRKKAIFMDPAPPPLPGQEDSPGGQASLLIHQMAAGAHFGSLALAHPKVYHRDGFRKCSLILFFTENVSSCFRCWEYGYKSPDLWLWGFFRIY